MEFLSFIKQPHYFFSANRQFEKGEYHMDRIYELSVLLLVRKGILRFNENGVPVEVRAGEYYIQKEGLYQQGVVPSDVPNYYFVHFKGYFDKSSGLPLKGTFDMEKTHPIIEELEKLGNAAEALEYESLFYKLLCTLKKNLHINSAAERIRAYLLDNFAEDITLDKIAKISLLSKNQTINVFKDAYGMPPHQYLIDFRLKKAGELILATNRTINEICFSVGFTEYSGFYRAFLKKFNLSPHDYRRRHTPSSLPTELYFHP